MHSVFPLVFCLLDGGAAQIGEIPTQGRLGKIVNVVVDPGQPRQGGQSIKNPLSIRARAHLRGDDERNPSKERVGADPVRTMERSPIGIPTRRAGSPGRCLQEQDGRGACNRRPDRFLSPFFHRRISKEQACPIGDEVHRHNNKRSPGNLEDLRGVVRFPAPKIRLIMIPYPPIDPGIGEDSGTSESDTQSGQAFPVEIKIPKIRFPILSRTGNQRIFHGKTRILHGEDKKGNQKEQGRNAFHGSTVMPLTRIHNRFLPGSCGGPIPAPLTKAPVRL